MYSSVKPNKNFLLYTEEPTMGFLGSIFIQHTDAGTSGWMIQKGRKRDEEQ